MRQLLAALSLLFASPFPAAAQAPAVAGIYHITVGAGPPTIVVLHGGPGFRHNYLRPEWDRLAQVAQVVYYDQRGCGLSPQVGPFGWPQHVQDLDSLLTFISPNHPVVLAGTSWGSWLALLYTYRHPTRVSRVILSGVPPWPDSLHAKHWSAFPASMRAHMDSLAFTPMTVQKVVDSAQVANMTAPAVVPPELARRLGPHCDDASLGAWYSLDTAPPLDSLAQITIPVLIVEGTGEKAQGTGAHAIATVLPRSQTIDILSGGHDPWFTAPDATFTAIEEWLRAH